MNQLGAEGDVASELDHLSSTIKAYLNDLMGRRRWNQREFAHQALQTIEKLSAKAATLNAPSKAEISAYLESTQTLMTELAQLRSSSGSESPTARALHDRLTAVSRAFLGDDLTLLETAAILSRLAADIDPNYRDPALLVFVAIDSEADHILIADTERGWHPDVAERRAEERQEFIERNRPDAKAAAEDLIRRFSNQSSA